MRIFFVSFTFVILFTSSLAYQRQLQANPTELTHQVDSNTYQNTNLIFSNSQNQQQPQSSQPTQQGGHQESPVKEEEPQGHHYLHPGQTQFWVNVLIALLLTCCGGFCSGMTVGLLSIDSMQLEVMKIGGTQEEKKMAERILGLITNHHLFLVTLLLANAMALETLPLIIHKLMPDWLAILVSTFAVLLVAEIIPQAYCTGPKKIELAYYATPIIQAMIKILWLLAYPMGKGLDYLLGVHGHSRIAHKDFANFLKGKSENLKNSEILLLTSILQLRTERVTKVMIPINKLYMLSVTQRLSAQKINQIYQKDYSYILVYKDQKQNVIGLVKVKQFAISYLRSGNKSVIVKDIYKEDQNFLSVYADTNLLQMLMLFQAKSYRIALVSEKKKKTNPGILSIAYSKSDMVADKDKIIGAVFLYSIFQQIAQFNTQLEKVQNKAQEMKGRMTQNEMQQITKGLLKNQH